MYLLKYLFKIVKLERVKRRRRLIMKLKKEMLKNSQKIGQTNVLVKDEEPPGSEVKTVSEIESANDYIYSNTSQASDYNEDPIQNKSIEYFLPPRRDFFLYTIHEHEIQTKKVFGFKKKPSNLSKTSELSKSDSNLEIK